MKKGKRFISIKTKLLSIILPVVIVIIVGLTGLSYSVSKDVIEQNAHELLETSVKGQAAKIEAWLDRNLTSFQVEKQALERMEFDKEQMQAYLDAYYNFDSNYPNGICLADTQGRLHQSSGGEEESEKAAEPESAADQSQESGITLQEWFRDGLTRVNMGFTDAYTNKNGDQVISACGMLRSSSNDVFVLSAELSLDVVSIYVNSFVEMEGAESFLVNRKDDTILACRDTSIISKKINELDDEFMQEISKRITSDETDMAEICGNISVFEEVEGTDWLLVSYIPSKMVYQDLDRVRNIMVLFGLVSVLILTVLMERIVHIFIRPVKKLTEVIKRMTDGDFTVRSYTKSNDEIGAMGKCVEKFIEAMRSMISSINGVSDTLRGQADSSRDVSGQMFSASKIQNESMKELNKTIECLSLSVGGIAESATTLAGVVAETKEDGDGVNSKMLETVDVSQKGMQAMQEVSEAMQNIHQSVEKLQSAIDEVDKASEEITNITKVIGNIAEETNLLSLNASIEAARAGDAGRGFAVVASEIGKLAQTSVGSVQNIDKLVMEIKSSIGDVVIQADDSVKNINSSSVLIQNAAKTFDMIFENIAAVNGLVHDMIQKVIHVESVAVDVAAISEEQAASSQKILDSSDILVKQANSLIANSETVAKESEDLTASAEELAVQMGSFKIQGNGAPTVQEVRTRS